ncbi:Uncharacterised protein [Vibrio cholerae]|nr:Uncharacterised protein [Vibrio cholerae]
MWYFSGEFVNHNRHHKVQAHTECTNALWADTEPPVGGNARGWGNELEVDDVSCSKGDPCQHTYDRPFFVHLLIEDAKDDRWEEGGCSQTEGEGHHLSDESRRIDAQITRANDGECGGNPRGEQLLLIGHIGFKPFLQQVMRNRG